MDNDIIGELIATQPDGHSLLQSFYEEPEVYEAEVCELFLKSWLYVGHTSQVPDIGDFYLFTMAGESLIIVRSAEDEICALINVCRHRGSLVCLEESGHASRFMCPYHAWTYGLDGRLRGAGRVQDDFDRDAHGLRRVQLVEFHGMLYVNFDDSADFSLISGELDEPLRPYDLARAKVAHRQNYPIDANWKLTVENYCECYHCGPSHPEYSAGHGRSLPESEVEDLLNEALARADAAGLSKARVNRSWLDAGRLGHDCNFDRTPLLNGHLTGSRDGKPLAPLLGSIKAYDGAATDVHIGPFTFLLAYCDHVVVYRFTPTDKGSTDCELTWLVRGDAVEGKDYDRDELTWLWDITTIADKRIIEDNRRGLQSRFYEPGPLTPMEYWTQAFIDWYLDSLARSRTVRD